MMQTLKPTSGIARIRRRGSFAAAAAASCLLSSADAMAGAPQAGGQQPGSAQAGEERRPMLLPQAVVLPRGDREIDIDGSLIDWPRLPAVRLDDRRQLSGTGMGAWRGPKDCSAMLFLMWDEQALYVSCTARDEWHRALDASTLLQIEIPAADSLLLSFDPMRNTRSNGPDPGRREDRDFWLADENGHEVVQWDRLRGRASVLAEPARMVVLHQKEEGITTYEALIPWSQILPPGQIPRVGSCLDLQVVLNDFDESTDSMPQTRIGWTFGMGPVVDPGIYGSIMLVGDDAPMRGVVPEFPPKPGVDQPPVESDDYWQQLTAQLLKSPPKVYDGALTPAETGGMERLQTLERIDEQIARFPRVDFLELHQRIHRRMTREIAGLSGRGLPKWWRQRLNAVSKQGEDPVPTGSLRFFRLPMGGWMVRSAADNFLIDPTGSDVRAWLWGAADLCLLTHPRDITRRNDQLLMSMYASKPPRPVIAHTVYHLPVVGMEQMPVVRAGQTYGGGKGTNVRVLGEARSDGKVSADSSYLVLLDGCPSVLIAGPSLRPEDVPEQQVGVMIASSRNPNIVAVAKRAQPDICLLDDAFRCSWHPQELRVDLRMLHGLQRALLPSRSVLLAPGESWQVASRDKEKVGSGKE